MRSSIACARCRRSKVKCINNGVNTTCRACETTGRECTYPPPATAGGASRRDSAAPGHGGEGTSPGDTPRRAPRPKRPATATPGHGLQSKESPRAMVDALDNALLTSKVWMELFDIFQVHFSTDLPFLHPPTFLKPLKQSSIYSPQNDPSGRPIPSPTPNAPPVLLLAFLALTSRFHPVLVAHHSPATSTRQSNPCVAAEYYAAAARARLAGSDGSKLGTPSLERTQALLMLALHEWGMCQGIKAWIAVGVAVRSAQIMGLQFEQRLDDLPLARSVALNTEARYLGLNTEWQQQKACRSKADEFIEQEIKRRTFWSCFVMDRYLSSGKYRPQMLNVKDLRIQLPSSERAFLFGEKVQTLLLGEEFDDVAGRSEVQNQRIASVMRSTGNGGPSPQIMEDTIRRQSHSTFSEQRDRDDEEAGRWELGANEGALSRFIKALDLYGEIVKWSCAGGRRHEEYPPWDERSTFFTLQRRLAAFMESLPRDLTLSKANISAHITSRTSTPYTLMHSLHSLCSIMLHREYVPFIPLRCSKPQGPLDPPLFPPDQYEIPPGFWEDSARECFKAARDLIDLLRTCQEWDVLVETPIVGFATYTAAFVGVYCINFPWMDPDGYMCSKPVPRSNNSNGAMMIDSDTSGAEAARKALEIVGVMRKRLIMADGWFRTIKRVHVYYIRIKKDFRRNTRALAASSSESDSPASYRHLSLREGGAGGGLEEYQLLEKTLKEFGSLEDEDLEMLDADEGSKTGLALDEGSESGSAAVKSEAMDMQEGTPDSAQIRQDRWNAINTVAAAASHRSDIGTPAMSNGTSIAHPASTMSTPSSNSGVPTLYQMNDHNMQRHSGASALVSLNQQSFTHHTAAPYERSVQQNAATSHYPTASVATGQFPPTLYGTEQVKRASLTLQQQLQSQQQQQETWSADMKENWLNNLDTRFGGDDVAAFVAGNNWEDWALMAATAQGAGGWLSAVWGNGNTM